VASRTIVHLVDDLDGKDIQEGEGRTVTFGFSGVDYSIDLSNKNAEKFEKALGPYLSAATRIGGRRRSNGSAPTAGGSVDPKAVRAWAVSNGYELSSRGRVPSEVVDAYKAAGN
jgi:hypothetical protein